MKRYQSIKQFADWARKAGDAQGKLAEEQMKGITVLQSATPQIKALGADGSRLVEFIITDDSIDRENDVIDIEGWELDNYKANPVILWAHDHYSVPIARAVSLYREGTQLRSLAEFVERDVMPFAYMVYQLYVKGYMNAVSVGFKPKEYAFDETRKYGINFYKQELLEYSCVPVPANPNALAVARSAGIDLAPMKHWAEKALDLTRSGSPNDEARTRLEVLRAASLDAGRALILEVSEMKDVADGAATTPPAPTPATTESAVKRVETVKWACGTDGCKTVNHDTEDDAKLCGAFGDLIKDLGESATLILEGVTKQGRVLSASNEEALRSAVAALEGVLAQLDKKEEEAEDEGKASDGELAVEFDGSDEKAAADDEELIDIDADALRGAIKDSVNDAIMQVTGRVD